MVCLNPIKAYGQINGEGFIDTQLSFKDNGGVKLYVPLVKRRRKTREIIPRLNENAEALLPNFLTLTIIKNKKTSNNYCY